ncbi:MAG: hypothetical protein LC118_17255 [Dehalococcoidia bacterium]|nr:hypothetical protein [Dehalococcoidia bacterium]
MSTIKEPAGTPVEVLTPARGAAVVSSDGEQFARVRQVRGGYFELDIPLARDFWLSCAHIASADAGRVLLNITRDDVDEHRLTAAGLETANDPHHADASDSLLSDEEELIQRERMEHAIADQHARMEKELAETEGVIDAGFHP